MSDKREHLPVINTHSKDIRHRIALTNDTMAGDAEQSMGALTCATDGRFQTVPRVSVFMVSNTVVTFK